MLVDDDPLMVRMYQSKFESEGNKIIVAEDGVTALSKIADEKPDLVLLDVMMPKLNGLEVLKRLKKDEDTKSIPVVMLTNVGSSDEDETKGLELGAVAYLVKADYTPKEVVQKVKEILSGYKRDIPEVKVKMKDKEEGEKETKEEPEEEKS